MSSIVPIEALLACPRRATSALEKGPYEYRGLVLLSGELHTPGSGVLLVFPRDVLVAYLGFALPEDELPVTDTAFQEQVLATLRRMSGTPLVVRYLQRREKYSIN